MTTTVQNYLDKGLRGLWYPVLASWEVQSAPVGITRLGEQIVVWRNKDGQVQALEDVCPHAYALLSQGFVEDGKVECPLHEAVFDVKTGQCLHGPGGRNLNRYPVRVYDNQIQITFIEENVA